MARHRHQEFIRFLNKINRETPARRELHLIVDNYATHKHPKVRAWLERHPRFHFHFTPTVRVSRPAVPGRSDPHSDRPFSVAGAAGCLGGLTRTPIDHDPCLSSDLSTAREHLATRFHLANARDPRRA